MKCVIHHAYFFPWLGYFSKLYYADKFILLDDALFSKGFYHDRTKYISSNGEIKWLTVPVGQNFKFKSSEVQVKDKTFLALFLQRIEQSYAKARHFDEEWPYLRIILINSVRESTSLFDLDVRIIKAVCGLLEFDLPEFLFSSELIVKTDLDKTDKLIQLCLAAGCNELIIGDGSSAFEHDKLKIEQAGIQIYLQSYFSDHPTYFQVRRQWIGFEKGISILDAILNVGKKETLAMIADPINQPKLFNLTIT